MCQNCFLFVCLFVCACIFLSISKMSPKLMLHFMKLIRELEHGQKKNPLNFYPNYFHPKFEVGYARGLFCEGSTPGIPGTPGMNRSRVFLSFP